MKKVGHKEMKKLVKAVMVVITVQCMAIISCNAQVFAPDGGSSASQNTGSSSVDTMVKINKDEYADQTQVINASKQAPQINISVIENIFKDNTESFGSGQTVQLKQFGYEIFNSAAGGSSTGKVSKGYSLTRGDKIKVYLWGDTLDLLNITGNATMEPVISTSVDLEGNIFVPSVGIIMAEGRTIADVERDMAATLSTKYANASVQITVEDPRSYPIMIMGQVKQPGNVYVNSSANFIDAIAMAGGALKTGSLRDITHIDSVTKKKTNIDIYKLLIKGDYEYIPLKEGDVILVKPIGKVVALADGVKSPAIFEYKKGESLKDVIGFAGGLLPSINPQNIVIESFDPAIDQKQVKDYKLADLSRVGPKDGDLLRFKGYFNLAENTVTLEGNVKHPGVFQYKEGMRLSDILNSPNDLLVNTNTNQAIIARVVGLNKGVVYIPVSLTSLFTGAEDPELRARDIVKIYESTNMETIGVSGKVMNPSALPYKDGMRLRDALGIVRLDANPNDVVVEITNPTQKDKLEVVYLYEMLTMNNSSLNKELKPNDQLNFRLISDEENLQNANVYGFVKSPGVFKVRPGLKLTELLEMSGGLEENGYLKGIVFLRPSVGVTQRQALEKAILTLQEDIASQVSSMQSVTDETRKKDLGEYIKNQNSLLQVMKEKAQLDYGRIVINLNDNNVNAIPDYYNLTIEDGDQVIIPSRPEHVAIMGEVLNQNVIAFLPDKNPKYYLDQVGGFTNQANKKTAYVIKANGRTEKLTNLTAMKIDPGDSIVVPKKVKIPVDVRGVLRDIFQMGFQATSTVFMINRLGN